MPTRNVSLQAILSKITDNKLSLFNKRSQKAFIKQSNSFPQNSLQMHVLEQHNLKILPRSTSNSRVPNCMLYFSSYAFSSAVKPKPHERAATY